MEDLEKKLGSILSDPEMMGKLQSMAQSLGMEQGPAPSEEPASFSMPELDPAMLSKIAGIAGKSGISREQRALLSALAPYLSRRRIQKLERAMQAAKMAQMATGLLGR